MGERMRMPRSRGGLTGTLLLLAGIWGALIPFVGPYFDWVIGPDDAFDMTEGRFWLSLVPGLTVIAGALILMGAANRISGAMGAWIALAGGAWFVVGGTVSRLFNDGQTMAGQALGGPTKQAWETLTYFEGLGALVVALAALALGRMTMRTIDTAGPPVTAREPAPEAGGHTRTGRFAREPETERTAVTEPQAVTAGGPGPRAPEAPVGGEAGAMRHRDPKRSATGDDGGPSAA